MDNINAIKLAKLSDELIELSRKYAVARTAAGQAEADLNILLASKYLKDIRKVKSNVGVEMAILMMCEESEEARGYYKTYISKRNEYKGLERIIEAIDKKLSINQSVMRFFRENDE